MSSSFTTQHDKKLATGKEKKEKGDKAFGAQDYLTGTSMGFVSFYVVALLNGFLAGEDSFEVLPRGECFNTQRQTLCRDGLERSRSLFHAFRPYRPCFASRA